MVETIDRKVEEKPQRARRGRPPKKQVEKGAPRAGEFLQEEIPEEEISVTDAKTGFSESDRETMDRAVKLQEVEARIRESAISKDARKLIHQEIKVDIFTMLRRYVELTPSMCDVRNCGFDAAIEMGTSGWDAAPVDQVMPDGKTFGQKLIDLKEYHKATAHTNQSLNDHIITAEELHKRQWGIGQDIRGEFITGPK